MSCERLMAFTATTTRHRPRYVAWSYSKLANWRNCPRQHGEVDLAKKWGQDGENEHIQFGNAVHEAMEHRLFRGTPIPAHLQSTLQMDLEKAAGKVLQGDANAEAWMKRTGGLLLPEQQLAMTDDFQPAEWMDRTKMVWLRAKIDVTKILGPAALLYDWKTGKVNDRESDQLVISAAMIFAKYPQVQKIRTCYVWLKPDATTTLDVTRDQMPEFWTKILPEVARYTKDVQTSNFPPKPSGLCGWCPVKSCEHNPKD